MFVLRSKRFGSNAAAIALVLFAAIAGYLLINFQRDADVGNESAQSRIVVPKESETSLNGDQTGTTTARSMKENVRVRIDEDLKRESRPTNPGTGSMPGPDLAERDIHRLYELSNQPPDDLDWLLKSRYWNPTRIQLNEKQLAELKELFHTGREKLEHLNKLNSDLVQKALTENVASGLALRLDAGAPYPKATSSSYFISITSAKGTFYLEVARETFPEIWYAREAADAGRVSLHDSIRTFFDTAGSQTK